MSGNAIRTHIYSIPDLIQSHAGIMWQRVLESLPEYRLSGIQKVVITGCGYSYAAAIQGKYILEAIAGIPVEAAFSVDASRHMKRQMITQSTLVIGISGSGIVARIAETLGRFQESGAMTLAMTGNVRSRCAEAAEYILDISSPPLECSLPLRSYTVTILGLYSVAWAIALSKKIYKEEKRAKFFHAIVCLAEELNGSLDKIERQMIAFSEKTVSCKAYEFVGSGMEYASAWLGRQQMIGQAGVCGIECSLEDWLHSDFFWNEPGKIATVLFAPSNTKALSRVKEVQKYMIYLQRPLCIVTDEGRDAEDGAARVILPYTEEYLLNPLLELIPVSLYAGQITEMLGEEYSRGFRERWDFSRGGYATEFSEIQIIE